jgi:RNA polymerase sigma-70 factor (ECF subfamily)
MTCVAAANEFRPTVATVLSVPTVATDADLVDRVATGDTVALALLYDRYATLLLALANRILFDATDAEDVVQETMTQVWRTAHRYDRSRASVSTWLTLLLRSRAIDRVRTRRVGERKLEAVRDEKPRHQASPVGDDHVLGRERRARLRQELRNVPASQRQVIELAYFEGLSQSEIAERTGVPLGTVKTRTLAAMRRLREALAPEIEDLL